MLKKLLCLSAFILFISAPKAICSNIYSVVQNTTTAQATETLIGNFKMLASTTNPTDWLRMNATEGIVSSRTITLTQAGLRSATATITSLTATAASIAGTINAGVSNSYLSVSTLSTILELTASTITVSNILYSPKITLNANGGLLTTSSATITNLLTVSGDASITGQGSMGTHTTAEIQSLLPIKVGAMVLNTNDNDVYIATGATINDWRNIRTGVAP